jgi:hypothetical protein
MDGNKATGFSGCVNKLLAYPGQIPIIPLFITGVQV